MLSNIRTHPSLGRVWGLQGTCTTILEDKIRIREVDISRVLRGQSGNEKPTPSMYSRITSGGVAVCHLKANLGVTSDDWV